jgi:hypothetical protein
MIMTLVLKSKPLRQFDRLAAAGEHEIGLTAGQRSDAGDPRAFW